MVSVPSVAWMRGSYALRKSSNAPHVTELPGSVCEEPGIPQVLVQLGSPDAQRAWEQFLLFYGAVLYQVARTSTRDEEEAADCFVFVCEKLAEKGYRRLLRFKPAGAASFVTWLRVVTRNLCFDWQRKVHGRPRPLKFLQNLSAVDLEVYQCRYERGLSGDDTLRHIRATWPAVTRESVNDIESRIARLLSPRQQWILTRRLASNIALPLDVDGDEERVMEIADPMPSPELTIFNEQELRRLRRSVDSLPSDERLIVQLRFEDELSLREIAQLMGLGDAQRTQRKLVAVLKKLRDAMEEIAGRKMSGRVREANQLLPSTGLADSFGAPNTDVAEMVAGGAIAIGAPNSTTCKTQIGAVHLYTTPMAPSQQPSYLFQPPNLVSTSGLSFGYGVALVPGYPFLLVGDHLQSVGTTADAGQVYVYKKN